MEVSEWEGKLPGMVCFFENWRPHFGDRPAIGSNPVATSKKINPSTLQLKFEGLLSLPAGRQGLILSFVEWIKGLQGESITCSPFSFVLEISKDVTESTENHFFPSGVPPIFPPAFLKASSPSSSYTPHSWSVLGQYTLLGH